MREAAPVEAGGGSCSRLVTPGAGRRGLGLGGPQDPGLQVCHVSCSNFLLAHTATRQSHLGVIGAAMSCARSSPLAGSLGLAHWPVRFHLAAPHTLTTQALGSVRPGPWGPHARRTPGALGLPSRGSSIGNTLHAPSAHHRRDLYRKPLAIAPPCWRTPVPHWPAVVSPLLARTGEIDSAASVPLGCQDDNGRSPRRGARGIFLPFFRLDQGSLAQHLRPNGCANPP